jgi:uncharacterized protein (TIGR01777 family)
MRVIITGGSGLIGRALTASLAGDGHEVIVLSRSPEKVTGLPGGARAVRWDGESAEGWGELVEGAAVVHLAGEGIAWTASKKRRIRDSRVVSSRAVTAAVTAATVKPRVVLQGSAVGYYGPRGDEEVTESDGPGDDFLAEVSLEWEGATAEVEELGVRRALLRTGVVLAADGGALPKMALPFRFFVGGPVGSGDQWVPWIHIDDEVGAIRHLLEDDSARGAFNLTAPEPVTNRQLSRRLGEVLGRPSFLPAPAFALRLVLGEMADLLLTGQRAVPQHLEETGYRFEFPTLKPALEDLLG